MDLFERARETDTCIILFIGNSITAVRIRAEVTAQAVKRITSFLCSKVELFVQIKLTEKYLTGAYLCCCSRMYLEHTAEKLASVSGPFVHKTIKRETCLPEYSCLHPRVLIPF